MKMFASLLKTRYRKRESRFHEELKQLHAVKRLGCSTANLLIKSACTLSGIFGSPAIERMWHDSRKELDVFPIPDGTGGVNPGDRRALYYLICALEPRSVLEIGTHIGASTTHIASALSMGEKRTGHHATVTTVDIADVNSPVENPWTKYGMDHSPIEIIRKLDYGAFVEFITDTSLNFTAGCSRKFDFIFLDGDHSARTVYQEIPAALNVLDRNGVVLLHDYFPDLKPLWKGSSVIPGPFLAVKRHMKEGANLTVLPLGTLPWPTKLNTRVTSLALLLRRS